MYILLEEHQYESRLVEKVLKDIYVLQNVDKKVSVQYVGYFYNPYLRDCVFILPKVLMTEQETLVGVVQDDGQPVTPEQILTPESQKVLSKEYRKFIYEFSVWIYRALNVFYKSHPDSKAILYKRLPQAGKGRRHQAKTYLDIVLSLINFNLQNRDFVLFTIKNLHRGNNKINWTRTISHTPAFIQDENVVYLNPVNKKRIINYEEELFVIYYSILNYLNQEYGFRSPINIQYDLITGRHFEQYLHGLGKTRLMQIKYKYFSDKALQLWDLCYAFFENSYRIAINTNAQEYLLAKNFNIVFEAIIDELIGTPHRNIPRGLADQPDGKRVDHLYTDLALTSTDDISNREVYYIGDSKYYKSGHPLTSESIYKQYTYARNVIQWNVDLFSADDSRFDNSEKENREADRKTFSSIRLQDNSLTEGYDIVPNFFIRAVTDNLKYDNGENNIRKHTEGGKHCTKRTWQFPDRLFDRDTLFLSQYDVNFLYVLYLYARDKSSEKAQWKQHVRRIFRDEIRDVIQQEFIIYAMKPRLGLDGERYLQQHFYELNGKVFQPYGKDRRMFFAYARPTGKKEETQAQFNELEKYFIIKKCDMGYDPAKVLEEDISNELQNPIPTSQWLSFHYLERYPERGVLIGYYKDENHLRWIMGENDLGTLVYNVRLKLQSDTETRVGAYTESFYRKQNVLFVILYTDGVEKTSSYRVFHVKDTAGRVSEERMEKTKYPADPNGNYFFFRFDEEVSLGNIDINSIISDVRAEQKADFVKGAPIFKTCGELTKYRK